MDIKDIIRKKRLELGLTYEELGKMIGVGKSTVRKWETGMIENMKRDNIIALAKALNISPALIMGWEEVKEESTAKYPPVTDVKEAMEIILAQPGLMLNGEMLSDESKIALANAIQMGLAYAEQMQKKEQEQKRNKE